MTQKAKKITGWVLTAILALMFAMSATMKLTYNETAMTQAAAIGFAPQTYFTIGLVEALALILFLIPRTGLVGGLLLIAYMGGAIATHLQHQQSIAMPVIFQVVIWISMALRFPEVGRRLFTSASETRRLSFQAEKAR